MARRPRHGDTPSLGGESEPHSRGNPLLLLPVGCAPVSCTATSRAAIGNMRAVERRTGE